MPILKIKALPQKDDNLVKIAIKNTAQKIATFYNCPPSKVWILWDEVQPNNYYEGHKTACQQPLNTHPPIVELIVLEGLSHTQIEELLTLTATTLSQSLGIPNNIFITYQEVKSGQVIAGNGLIRS